MTTPSAAQIETLLNFLEEHRDLARGLLRNVDGRASSHRLWENISTTLNAMGGCTKTIKQWQKLWTDKKYLTKKAAAAARRSASATGGGPSTAPQLSHWDLRVMSIMGDGFGGSQTTARVPAFVRPNDQQSASLQTISSEPAFVEPNNQQSSTQAINTEESSSQETNTEASISTLQIPPSIRRRRPPRHRSVVHGEGSVRERLYQIEEDRREREVVRNQHLQGINDELRLLRQVLEGISEQLRNRV